MHDDYAAAFAAYESVMRAYVAANQALAIKKGANHLLLRTKEELEARNRTLASMQRDGATDEIDAEARAAHNALTLPDYGLSAEGS